jgi:MFS transporter, DHA3 family, macrolide efflux protein
VFAVDYLIGLVIEASASLIAGFLADRVFEPAMQPGGQWVTLFSSLFGSGKGTGIAFLYALTAIGIVIIGLVGYRVKSLNNMEDIVPDHSDG